MTNEDLAKHSSAFRAGYHDGYRNIKVTPIPKIVNGKIGANDIADYWWGYHTGGADREAEQMKRLIK
jgi:hypothetical protein